MVTSDQRKDLHNMYTLLKPVEMGLPVLVKELQDHITRTGLEAIGNCFASSTSTGTSSPESMSQCFVDTVLDVHRKFTLMIREVFNSDQQFMGALDLACSVIVNHRRNPKVQCRSAELLSRYCDSLLKKSPRNMSESEIDEKLSSSITVFKYIDDKDVFQKFYAKMFAKRLIHQVSVSMDAEEGMINKLKNACGYEYTSKFHRMFTDIKLSDDLGINFDSWIKSNYADQSSSEALGIGFSIFVLQAGAWPLGQAAISPFAVPQPLERPVSYFETFYNSKFNGRKLTWLHHLSTTEMRLTFPDSTTGASSKVYHVSMGTYHMAILDLFESVNSMTYKELQVNTKLSDEQLVKHLQSLLEAKLILTFNPAAAAGLSSSSSPVNVPPAAVTGDVDQADAKSASPAPGTSSSSASPDQEESKTISSLPACPAPDTMFYLNVNFSNKRTKFKITAVIQKEVQQVRRFVIFL
jgi:cullin 2